MLEQDLAHKYEIPWRETDMFVQSFGPSSLTWVSKINTNKYQFIFLDSHVFTHSYEDFGGIHGRIKRITL